jgi:hypothetical protein
MVKIYGCYVELWKYNVFATPYECVTYFQTIINYSFVSLSFFFFLINILYKGRNY